MSGARVCHETVTKVEHLLAAGPTAACAPCLVAVSDASEAAAAGRLDPNDVAVEEVARDLRREL